MTTSPSKSSDSSSPSRGQRSGPSFSTSWKNITEDSERFWKAATESEVSPPKLLSRGLLPRLSFWTLHSAPSGNKPINCSAPLPRVGNVGAAPIPRTFSYDIGTVLRQSSRYCSRKNSPPWQAGVPGKRRLLGSKKSDPSQRTRPSPDQVCRYTRPHTRTSVHSNPPWETRKSQRAKRQCLPGSSESSNTDCISIKPGHANTHLTDPQAYRPQQ